MKRLGAPWQVWGVIALAPVHWLLYEVPGDPYLNDGGWWPGWIILALALLLLGSKLAWLLSTVATGVGAFVWIFFLFDPTANEASMAVMVALTATTLAQFALLVSRPTMDWVGVGGRRVAAEPQ
jgi:hypothetical protein